MNTKKTLLITGGSGGVAQALLPLALAAGWRVVLASRQALEVAGATCITADVSQAGGAAALFEALKTQDLLPDALAHMAGSTLIAPLARTSEAQYRAVMAANVDSAFFTLQAFCGACKAAGKGGSAVLASSVVAQMGTSNHEAIAAAKGAVEALVRAAAASHAAAGIRVNAVAPGLTETPMTRGITQSPVMREAAGKQYPLGGINAALDVARVAWWLASDETSRITGQVWAVDGGFTAIRPLVK